MKHKEVNHSINPQLNNVLPVTTGSFRESRKSRGGAKNQEVPVHGALLLDELEELFLASTGIPEWVTAEEYTPMLFDDESHSTLTPTYTTHSISTSSGTTQIQSTKKRSPKKKQTSTTTASLNENKVTHRVATRSPDHPTEPIMADPPTPLVEDVGPVSVETDGALIPEEHAENRPNSKKNKQSSRSQGIVHCFRNLFKPSSYS